MSTESDPNTTIADDTGVLEWVLAAAGAVVVVLYVVGIAGPGPLAQALDLAGLLTAMLAVAATVLWIGDRI